MQCYHSLRGVRCRLNPSEFANIETLKRRLSETENIEPTHILLLASPSGQQLKESTVASYDRIFVYDKSWGLITQLKQLNLVDDQQVEPFLPAEYTEPKIEVCTEATNTVVTHLKHNINAVERQLNKLLTAREQISTDIEACRDWPRSWAALLQIPELGHLLPEILDKDWLSSQFKELDNQWTSTTMELDQLQLSASNLENITLSPVFSLEEAQQQLISTLRAAGETQARIAQIRKPLSRLSSAFKQVDQMKAEIAQIIDLPFVFGVLKIERARRQRWEADKFPFYQREQKRRQRWQQHYGEGPIGALVKRIQELQHENLMEPFPNQKPKENENLVQQVDEYITQLDNLGLTDVCRDLKKESEAMHRYSSLTASGFSLASSTSSLPISNNGTIAAYEARIRKFEMLLMQARSSNNTKEIDIVRAETRAEAKAEAKAEFALKQQQNRITELEAQNAELLKRLSEYSMGCETSLNAMGLQTSRVDGKYQVNRVKGLGKRTTSSIFLPDGQFNYQLELKPKLQQMKFDNIVEQTNIVPHTLVEAVTKRFTDVERLARMLQTENKKVRGQMTKLEYDLKQRVALRAFKAGDLILFLPSRDSRKPRNIWAAFNSRAPHYFLHPKDAMQLKSREYLLARATTVEKHIVDGKSENPFQLPLGVEWYLIRVDGE